MQRYTTTLDDVALRQMQIKATIWSTAYAAWLPIKEAEEPNLDHSDLHTLVCEHANDALRSFLNGEGIIDPLYEEVPVESPLPGAGENVVRLEPK